MNIFTVLIDEMMEKFTFNWFYKTTKSLSEGSPAGNNAQIVSRVLLFFAIVVIIKLIYSKLLQGLFRRMELSELSRSQLIEAIWYTAMCFIGSIAFGIIFKFDYNVRSIEDVYNFLFKEKTFLNENSVSGNLLQLFTIFSALHFFSVASTLCSQGCDLEFFTRLCFTVFFCGTYSVRHILLGLVCVWFMNINTIFAELARIFCILGRKKSHQIYSMKYLAYSFFGMHCLTWTWLFGYFLPSHVLWPMLNIPTNRSEVLALMVLYLMLWTVYWLQLVSAPLSRLLINWKWSSGSYLGQTSVLDVALFPAQDEMLRELKQIRNRIQELERQQHRSSFTNTGKPIYPQHTEGTRTIYQTIKCVMALKKRLKQKREQRLNSSASAPLPSSNNNADNRVSNDANPEGSDS